MNKPKPICINCEEARQAGDKSKQDVVGCRMLNMSEGHMDTTLGTIYSGWFYGGRRPFDVEESREVGRGMLHNGFLISADGTCSSYIDSQKLLRKAAQLKQ